MIIFQIIDLRLFFTVDFKLSMSENFPKIWSQNHNDWTSWKWTGQGSYCKGKEKIAGTCATRSELKKFKSSIQDLVSRYSIATLLFTSKVASWRQVHEKTWNCVLEAIEQLQKILKCVLCSLNSPVTSSPLENLGKFWSGHNNKATQKRARRQMSLHTTDSWSSEPLEEPIS